MAQRTCNELGVSFKVLNLEVLNQVAPSSLTRNDQDIPEGHFTDDSMKDTVVPNRNMVMLSIAASYAISLEASAIYYGAHGGDHAIYPDCRPQFFEKLDDTIQICDWHKVELRAPYMNVGKDEIVKEGLELGVDFSQTWTCYKGGEKACGKCGSCRERLEVFEEIGVEDPLEYRESN